VTVTLEPLNGKYNFVALKRNLGMLNVTCNIEINKIAQLFDFFEQVQNHFRLLHVIAFYLQEYNRIFQNKPYVHTDTSHCNCGNNLLAV